MTKKKDIARYNKVFEDKKVYEMTDEEKGEIISKEVAETCRHRSEKKWYRFLVFLNFAAIITVIISIVVNFNVYFKDTKKYVTDMAEEISSEVNIDTSNEKLEESSAKDKKTDKKIKNDKKDKKDKKGSEVEIPLMIQVFFIGIFAIISMCFTLYYYYAYCSARAVRITEKNFPEVYETIKDYSRRLGIEPPKAYVAQQSGVLNAFATFLFRKKWIMIHSEIFEVAYREHHDMDALNFVIGHELAHIYYGHASFMYQIKIIFSGIIPVLATTASRTREYSCDRLAQRLTGVDGIDAMLMIVIDRHLYKMVDKEDYINEMKEKKGFFLWIANLLLDHPIMSKRILALKKGRESGKLY